MKAIRIRDNEVVNVVMILPELWIDEKTDEKYVLHEDIELIYSR